MIEDIQQELIKASSLPVKQSAMSFFKESIDNYGVKSGEVKAIGKTYFKKLKGESKEQVFKHCTTLWQSGKIEEAFIACHWSHNMRKQFITADLNTFEHWISNYITNWATCDTFCNHTVGDFLIMYPECISEMYRWAASSNRWMRRAAAVSLIVPARRGLFKEEIFTIASQLLLDPEDMVQKGYGWLLKVTSQTYQTEVLDFVLTHKAKMPRTALRYAIEKMPTELKKQAMKR